MLRLSGLELLLALVNRVGNQKMSAVDSETRLVMEAIRKFNDYNNIISCVSGSVQQPSRARFMLLLLLLLTLSVDTSY